MKQEPPFKPTSRPPSPRADEATAPPRTSSPTTPSLGSRAQLVAEQFPVRFGRYEIRKLLGKGGMGAVYLAQDTQLDRAVALKLPSFAADEDTQLRDRFFQEARTAATLRHANICPVHDIGVIDGQHFLTMTFIEGQSLAQVLHAQTEPMPVRDAVELVRKLAVALEEAHANQVVHRDLKPANIMIDARGEPVIMDFGLGRRGGQDGARLTQDGSVMGTPAYMPPEQARGDTARLGPPADIYSLGVILYEVLTGRRPFEGDTMSVLAKVLADPPPPPSSRRAGIDPKLEAICLKCLAKQPEARFRSMAGFTAALDDYLAAPTAGTAPPRRAALAHAPSHTGQVLGWAIVLVILSAMGGIAFWVANMDAGKGETSTPLTKAETTSAVQPTADAHEHVIDPGSKAATPSRPASEDRPPEFNAELLRTGKIFAPDLGRLEKRQLDFATFKPANHDLSGYEKGVFYVKGGYYPQFGEKERLTDFACEANGRTVGSGVWQMLLLHKGDNHGLAIEINRDGMVRVMAMTPKKEKPAANLNWTHHAFLKRNDEYNKVLVIVRHAVMEVYVNHCAVCNPIRVGKDFAPTVVHLGLLNNNTNARAEFTECTLWPQIDSLPPLEKRTNQTKTK